MSKRMNRFINIVLILAILFVIGVGLYDLHAEACWTYYDKGYNDAMHAYGIEFVNEHRVMTERDWILFDEGFDYALDYIDHEPVEKPTEIELCGQIHTRTGG